MKKLMNKSVLEIIGIGLFTPYAIMAEKFTKPKSHKLDRTNAITGIPRPADTKIKSTVVNTD